mmetsp:Transcript_11295/g.23358  ORF Transcript_11295/g.23358 Transcript_11295/m.23358 type:complete len:274 (+) Transcript_11295:72-893(+)
MDVGDDPKKWQQLREKREKEKAAKKEQEENEIREARTKKRRKENEALEFKPGLRVMVTDLASNTDKNGSLGTLVEFITAKDRWAVQFDSGSRNNFKIDNLVLQEEKEGPRDCADDNEEAPTAKIYVTNLSEDTTQAHLIKLFGGIGTIARTPVRDSKGKSKGFADTWPYAVKLYKPGANRGDALVEFEDRNAAKAATKTFNGHKLNGSVIGVTYAGGGGKKAEEKPRDRDRSRSRERIEKLERERQRELANVMKHIEATRPIDDAAVSRYFGK